MIKNFIDGDDDRIEVKNKYMYIHHNFNNDNCKELFNNNMVF